MLRAENFIYFFTVSGFFIGLIFSILNFAQPEDILLYTALVTLFFYLFIHVVVMNFVDVKRFGASLFAKYEYESISEYFVSELDTREKSMDALLLELESLNKKYQRSLEDSNEQEGVRHQKAA